MTCDQRPRAAELTGRAVVLGLLLSVVMGAANVYLGLKAGMTVSASIPAAVMAMIILRGLLRTGTVLESNQVQTAASAGESLAAGIIFTMPALVLIGRWSHFDLVLTTLVALAGGMLGVLFMIPMRRVFVTTQDTELKYPEGVACAAVLKAAETGAQQGSALAILQGGALGAVLKLAISFLGLLRGTLEGAGWLAGRLVYFGGDVSPALVAVGFIVGLDVAVLIFVGGALAWLVGIPLMSGGLDPLADPLQAAQQLWSTQIRYLGVGCMVVGGVASIWRVRRGLVAAIGQLWQSATDSGAAADNDRDLPPAAIAGLALATTALVGGIYYRLTGHLGITLVTTAIMVVMSFFFTAVASYIVGLVGNSNSPVSGMTITTVLFTGLLLLAFGFQGGEGMAATLGVAAIVCCAACTSGDVCNDLKTGQLVGASPFRQQLMQIAGVAVASLVMAPVLQLLHDNTPGGIGGRELPAPQAALFASLAKGFFGDGQLRWDLVGCGALVGVGFLLLDRWLAWRGSPFRAHVMPIAVGMYLPFGLAVPILAGGLLAHQVGRVNRGRQGTRRLQRGVLFSSGAIAGESLMGIGIAVLASLGIARLQLGLSSATVTLLTAVAIVPMLGCFWWSTRLRGQVDLPR